ncbi:MAG TPA: hypothetical protein VGE92_12255, partial [Steroidobacteraceae bacterium]
MTSFQIPRTSRGIKGANGRTALTVLGALLSASPAGAQTTNTQQPIKRPVVPVPQKPATGVQNNLFSAFGAANNNSAAHTAPVLSPQAQKFLNPNANTAAGNNTPANRNPLAALVNPNGAANRQAPSNLNNLQRPVATGPQVPARSVPGLPAPRGAKEMQGHNGSIIRTASDGSVLD